MQKCPLSSDVGLWQALQGPPAAEWGHQGELDACQCATYQEAELCRWGISSVRGDSKSGGHGTGRAAPWLTCVMALMETMSQIAPRSLSLDGCQLGWFQKNPFFFFLFLTMHHPRNCHTEKLPYKTKPLWDQLPPPPEVAFRQCPCIHTYTLQECAHTPVGRPGALPAVTKWQCHSSHPMGGQWSCPISPHPLIS